MPQVLVAIPTFNERSHVRDVIAEVRKYVPDVLVVDDGSTDGTRELVEKITGIQTISHPENYGYGQALISAFHHAIHNGYEWLITIDCDHQHEPEFIPDFMAAARQDDADIISGSRYLRLYEGNGDPPADRRRINQTITHLLNHLLGLQLTDAFCGFKAYRTSGLEKLSIDVPGYAMPLQLWVRAVDRGLRVREIPVRLIYNDPNRHFGGGLDDPEFRLKHYLSVLYNELKKRQVTEVPQTSNRLKTGIQSSARARRVAWPRLRGLV